MQAVCQKLFGKKKFSRYFYFWRIVWLCL